MMTAKNNDNHGAIDQAAFETAIRENLSPEGVAAIIAFLQPASMRRGQNETQRAALRQVEWFANTLMQMLGVQEFNRLVDEIGL